MSTGRGRRPSPLGARGEPAPVEPVPVEPMPVEPMPDGEPVVITLVDVQPDLWWAWDADGAGLVAVRPTVSSTPTADGTSSRR